ncbi:MAG: substrate-binding domain-containing protein [Tepidisphaeraceae bacterium]
MIPKIRLLLALNREEAFDRRAFHGVMAVARHYGDIAMHQLWGETFEVAKRKYVVDGIILSSGDREIVGSAVATGKPCVNIANLFEMHDQACVVGTNDLAIGRMVAQHYMERGFEHFAFYTTGYTEYFRVRQQGFVDAVRAAGFDCAIGPEYPDPAVGGDVVDPAERIEQVGRWLASLPKPLGLLAPHDRYAHEVIDICNNVGIQVPAEVSVIGVDNDDYTCMAMSPQISSVETNAIRIGQQAVEVMRAIVLGQEPPPTPVLVPPVDIVLRGSSSATAVADTEVALAVQYIHNNVHKRVTIENVVEHVLISRRSLEKRFLAATSRSLMEEIRRSRVAHAKRLLVHTELSLGEIARRCGYLRQQRLSKVIHDETGMTPGAYRKSHRAGA